VVQEWLSENRIVIEENFYELNPRLRPLEDTKKVAPITKKKKGKK
jgi:hypothetical protein